jgi:hypothetical protein
MKKRFKLTFEVVTNESAECGDAARRGFVPHTLNIPSRTYMPKRPAQFGLREAVSFLKDRESAGPVEADSCPLSLACPPRWFTYGGSLDWHTGEYVSVSMHLPERISAHSAMRIARLVGCYGAKPRVNPLLERLRHHITGAIERGEAVAIAGIPA